MAKSCMIARETVRTKLVASAKKVRDVLRATIKDQTIPFEEKMEAVKKLNKRKRDESPIRKQRRCNSCGRPHAVYRRFKLCRICLRKAVMEESAVPGVRKASW